MLYIKLWTGSENTFLVGQFSIYNIQFLKRHLTVRKNARNKKN